MRAYRTRRGAGRRTNLASPRQALGTALAIFPSLGALRRAGAISARTASLQPIGPHALPRVSFAGIQWELRTRGCWHFPHMGPMRRASAPSCTEGAHAPKRRVLLVGITGSANSRWDPWMGVFALLGENAPDFLTQASRCRARRRALRSPRRGSPSPSRPA